MYLVCDGFAICLLLVSTLSLGDEPGEASDESDETFQMSLLQKRADIQRADVRSAQQQQHSSAPSIFVAVFTRRSNWHRRALIRDMYSMARVGVGGVVARFVLCRADDGLQNFLDDETRTYEDLLLLECEEGYEHGLLTRKTAASMQAHVEWYSDRDLFMKVDDDTFIAWGRLDSYFEAEGWNHTYGGVLYPNCSPVERNPGSAFYEPSETWKKDTFPASMAGGPGYLLDTKLVHQILGKGLPEAYPLWNEDKAVGVWIDALRKDGVPIKYVNISGSDGYFHPNQPYICGGLWGEYPFVLHHDLSGEAIACLSRADVADDASRDITHCFKLNDEDCNPSTDTGKANASRIQLARAYMEKMKIYSKCAEQEPEQISTQPFAVS